jgi:ATP-dependent DNA ligase
MNHFNGPQPRSIERRHFQMLASKQYVVCEKTDGIRYILRRIDDSCEIINRALEITSVNLNLPRQTVLDGELVTYKSGRKMFIIHDAMIIRSEDVTQLTLTERLDRARQILRSVIQTPKSSFGLVVKKMVPLNKFDTLPLDFPYDTDGLIFTPVDEPVRSGTHETMFKWKPKDRITIDFLIKGQDLYLQDCGKLYKETEMHERHNFPDGTILECAYNELGWSPVKVRKDKTHPNNRRTYLRTLVNLKENITYEEFKGISRLLDK